MMIRCAHLGFAFDPSLPLFSDASFHLDRGWTGVVGANGAGKTTLLRLIAGELTPDSGTVQVLPSDSRIAYCPQRVDALTSDIEEFAWCWDSESMALKSRLGLDESQLERWPSLSPGERKRWQVAAALAAEPTLLVLDEPTNHLDRDSRQLLVDRLLTFTGIGVVVSHDRELLDTLTSRTLRIHGARIEVETGSYSTARDAWEQERQRKGFAYEQLHKEERSARRVLATKRQNRAQLDGSYHVGSTQGRRDPDSTSMQAKGRKRHASAKLGRQVGVARGVVERVHEQRRAMRFDKEVGRAIQLLPAATSPPILASLPAGTLSVAEKTLFDHPQLDVPRGGRIWISGPNGVGKSTLITALLCACPRRDSLLVVPQHIAPRCAQEWLHRVQQLPPDERGKRMQIIAALGVDPARLLHSKTPSPGEARKLAIADGLARQVAGLVLDEPTNHMDLASKERLEEAIAAYSGVVILVSHDRLFARACAKVEWACNRQGLRIVSLDGEESFGHPATQTTPSSS